MSKTSYLDYAAATPVLSEVLDAMRPYFSTQFFNPSALYGDAVAVHEELEKARAAVAHHLGAKKEEVVFTSGATEANNLAIQGILQQYPAGTVLTSAIEHDSVLKAATVYNHGVVKVMRDGLIDLDDLQTKLRSDVVLVSIMYANNEIGTIQDLRAVAAIIEKEQLQRKKAGNSLPLYLHTDAAQAPSYLDLHVHALGVDLMTLNSGKIYGPKGVGALYVSRSVRLQPQTRGGGQERGVRSGTENVGGIVGFAKALDIAQELRPKEVVRLQELQANLIRNLESLGGQINGSVASRLVNNIHVTFSGQDNERLLYALDQKGIQVAAGSACSASSDEPSHVLKAIGLSDKDAQASLRITTGRFTKQKDIDSLVAALQELVG